MKVIQILLLKTFRLKLHYYY